MWWVNVAFLLSGNDGQKGNNTGKVVLRDQMGCQKVHDYAEIDADYVTVWGKGSVIDVHNS